MDPRPWLDLLIAWQSVSAYRWELTLIKQHDLYPSCTVTLGLLQQSKHLIYCWNCVFVLCFVSLLFVRHWRSHWVVIILSNTSRVKRVWNKDPPVIRLISKMQGQTPTSRIYYKGNSPIFWPYVWGMEKVAFGVKSSNIKVTNEKQWEVPLSRNPWLGSLGPWESLHY